MKRYRFIIYMSCVLPGVLFFSGGCIKDSCQGLRDNDGNGAYLVLHIMQAERGRSTGDQPALGSEGEREISNLHVYLAKPDFSEIRKVSETEDLIRTPEGYKSRPIEVVTGDYLLYLVANATHADRSAFIPSVVPVSGFSGPYTLDGEDEMGKFATDGFFVMANEQHAVPEEPGYSNGGVPVSIRKEHTQGNPSVVSVRLDRLAAKIVPDVSEGVVSAIDGIELLSGEGGYSIARVEVDGVGLLNAVNSFNLVQQWAKGESYASDIRDMCLVSPAGKAGYPLTGYYHRISEYVDGVAMTVKPEAPFVAPGTALYCLENHSFDYPDGRVPTKYKGRTTAVLFRVKAYVNKRDEDVPGVTELSGHTFYGYDTYLFATLEELKQSYPELSALESCTQLRQAGVQVYEEGYMYYTHWIRDTNHTDNGEYYYSVVRNTRYGLTVVKISGLGDDIPGGPYDPEDPIDPDDMGILIYPECERWSYIEVSHGFN